MLKKYLKHFSLKCHLGQSGFSLVEMAIGLALLGAFTAGALATYNVISKQENDHETRGKLRTLEAGINNYYIHGNARYPCPSALNAKEGDANFGQEFESGGEICKLSAIKLCSDLSWKATEGVCKTEDGANAVIIGAVPFAVMQIGFDSALDFWRNKIIYAVTHQKTNVATFDSHSGAIKVFTPDQPNVDDGIPDLKVLADPADIFLFSTGDNGIGGFTKDGFAHPDCRDPATGYETENCDFDDTFLSENDPDYTAGVRSFAVGPTYYDDLTIYKTKIKESVWFPQPVFVDDVLTLAAKVGIGTTNPSYNLEVKGNVIAPDQVRSKLYCDNIMSNCLDPETITGTKPVMNCEFDVAADEQAVMKLASSRVYCTNTADRVTGGANSGGLTFKLDMTIFKPKDCMAEDKLVIGFDAIGTPICQSP